MTKEAYCWIVFILYSFLVIGMGAYSWFSKKKENKEHCNVEFWMAGRSIPGWDLGISIASGWLMLGWISFGMSQVYAYGYLYIGTGVLVAVIVLISVSLLTKKPSCEHLSVVSPKPLDGADAIKEIS